MSNPNMSPAINNYFKEQRQKKEKQTQQQKQERSNSEEKTKAKAKAFLSGNIELYPEV